MSARRLLLVAAAVGILSTVIFLVSVAARPKPPQDKPSISQPTGPASDAAERARADLAARLGTTRDKIAIVSVQEHTWNDASIGLPEPGMMYAQVLTPGHIVTLRYGGRTYVYHVAGETVKLNPKAH